MRSKKRFIKFLFKLLKFIAASYETRKNHKTETEFGFNSHSLFNMTTLCRRAGRGGCCCSRDGRRSRGRIGCDGVSPRRGQRGCWAGWRSRRTGWRSHIVSVMLLFDCIKSEIRGVDAFSGWTGKPPTSICVRQKGKKKKSSFTSSENSLLKFRWNLSSVLSFDLMYGWSRWSVFRSAEVFTFSVQSCFSIVTYSHTCDNKC